MLKASKCIIITFRKATEYGKYILWNIRVLCRNTLRHGNSAHKYAVRWRHCLVRSLEASRYKETPACCFAQLSSRTLSLTHGASHMINESFAYFSTCYHLRQRFDFKHVIFISFSNLWVKSYIIDKVPPT